MNNIKKDLQDIYQEPRQEDNGKQEESREYYFNPEDRTISPVVPENQEEISAIKKPKNSHKKIWITLLVLGLLVIGGFAGYEVYKNLTMSGAGGRSLGDIFINIKGPEEIISAAPAEYRFVLENKKQAALKEVELVLRFPKDFYYNSSNPQPQSLSERSPASGREELDGGLSPIPPISPQSPLFQRYVWAFPLIKPGEKIEIKVIGRMFGKVGDKKTITAELFYRLENFSSEFKEMISFTGEVTEDLIALEIEGPEKALANQEAEYVVTLSQVLIEDSSQENQLTQVGIDCVVGVDCNQPLLKDLKIFIEYPEGFELNQVSPLPKQGEGEEYWEIDSGSLGPPSGSLGPLTQAIQEIKIIGILSGESGTYKELKVRAGFDLDGGFRLPFGHELKVEWQTQESFLTLLLEPKLGLDLQVNNLSLPVYAADWGEKIRYALAYKNSGDLDVSDIILRLDFTGDLIVDWGSFSCGGKECEVMLSKHGLIQGIIWRKEQIKSLAKLEAGRSGEIDFSIALIDKPPAPDGENYHLRAQIIAQAELVDFNQSFEAMSEESDIRIKTEIKLNAEARYFTDEYLKIGSGPLPPRVGETTIYRIFWELENTSNAVKDVLVSTVLPDWMGWPDEVQVSVGEIIYDEGLGQVVWSIPEVKAYAGQTEGEIRESHFQDRAQANFEVSLTPRLNQQGQYVVLTQETSCSGTDSFTEQEVSARQGYLTTDLDYDLGAMGKGVVE
ncbi:hypothetical protein L6279_01165 [Candidatus Parcubacteria bacterium]|nr:hypothetical protein [Candidatus Parcubacteria bacterium]